MQTTYRLRHRDQTILFEGQYRNFRDCVEDAFARGASLDGANFSHADLSEAELDGIHLHHVDFTGANLTGANISEAVLRDCVFDEAALFNACFCASDLTGSFFSDAQFGATDFAGALIEGCIFSGPSVLGLNLKACASLSGSAYISHWQHCEMSHAPVVISGLPYPVALFDRDILLDHDLYRVTDAVWHGTGNAGLPSQELYKALSLLRSLKAQGQIGPAPFALKSTES